MSRRAPKKLSCKYQYFNNPCCECNINYTMSYLFLITSSSFICYVIYENPVKIQWGEYGNTSKFVVSLSWILLSAILARCMCVTERYEEDISEFNNSNNYLYYNSDDETDDDNDDFN